MFYKNDLSSQVLTTLVMYHDYIGTLTEVDDVLQESAEILHADHAVHELHAEEGFGFVLGKSQVLM